MTLVRAVLFDLGNTLVHYHEGPLSDEEKDFLGLRAMVTKLESWGIQTSFDELRDRFYRPWLELFAERKQSSREFDVFELIGRAVSLEGLTPSQLRELMLAFHEPTAARAVADEGTRDALRTLREAGMQLGLLSNSAVPGYCHDDSLRRLGLLDCLDFRLYSYDEGVRKPDVRIFERALDLAGVSSSEAVMVGDSWQLDLEPACRLGMRVIQYHSPRRGEKRALAIPAASNLGDASAIPEAAAAVKRLCGA